jgi:benzoate membrane transport protein
MQFFRDLSLSTLTAGFVAVLVGFTSSIAIVFQAAQAFGASQETTASWMWALGLGMGLCTLLPSLWLRKPVMVAWSTPGAAVLASAGIAGGFTMHDAVGAFLACALLITLLGLTGWFERLMHHIPQAIASALLAGVLAKFSLAGFLAAKSAPGLVITMLMAYLLSQRWFPRYAVPLTLAIAIVFVAFTTGFSSAGIHWGLTLPVWTQPAWSWQALVSLALPLLVVTMASQNLPGVAAISACGFGDQRAHGGDTGIPISKIISLTGLATLALAPFGAFALNLSAITAAICMGPQAHADPARRYTAAVCCGAIYILLGLFGATIMGLLNAFPQELVAAIAGLALLGTIGAALKGALDQPQHRDAALITFLVTLSGVTLGAISSAFWGIVMGVIVMAVQHPRWRTAPGAAKP